MRHLRFFIFLAFFLMFCTEASAISASYKQIISGGGMEKPQTSLIKIKGDKMRMEAESPKGTVVSIINGQTVYSYFPAENRAAQFSVPRTPKMDVLANYDKYLETLGAVVIGSEKIGQHDCAIYEFKDPKTQMMSKAWVCKVTKFPIKVEAQGPDGTFTTVIENLEVGIEIDDSEFELPEGVEITEMR